MSDEQHTELVQLVRFQAHQRQAGAARPYRFAGGRGYPIVPRLLRALVLRAPSAEPVLRQATNFFS